MTPDLVAAMRQHKAELHDLVEAFEERAGIAEYCGHLSRHEAEALAWQSMREETPGHPFAADVPVYTTEETLR
jgi:hypothetical protein